MSQLTPALTDETTLLALTRHLLLSPNQGLAVYDRDLRFLVWNRYMERLSGVTADEVVGRHPLEVFPFLEATGLIARLQRALAGETPEPMEIQHPAPGVESWHLDMCAPLRDESGNLIGVVSTIHPVTELRKAEAGKRKLTGILTDVLESSGEAFIAMDHELVVTYFNAAAERMLGRGRGEVVGRYLFDAFPEARGTIFDEKYHEAERERRALTFEVRFDVPPYENWFDVRVYPTADGISVFFQITTDRKRAEQALADSRQRLEFAVRSTDAGVWDWNVVDNTMVWDDRMHALYGHSRESTPDGVQAWQNGLHPDDRDRAIAECEAALRGERPFDTEFRVVRPDGSVCHVKADALVLRDESGAPQRMIGLNRDVTERRRTAEEKAQLEEQLRQAQKMEAIGTLAGGVAHDFNNILGGIMGGLALLELDLGSHAGHNVEIQNMKALVRRGSDLSKQLLGFARRGKYDAKPLDLARVLAQTSDLFARTRRDILIEHHVEPGLLAVLMDHTQLEQVLLNLFVNAGHAMPGGGTLVVSAETTEFSPQQAEIRGVEPGRFIKLVVRDSGVGMDAATRARVFEPFFTTKAPGLGSGLGLASVYGIVRNHGGCITVDSEPGCGATFTIFLPASNERPADAPVTQATAVPTGKGTILVVDDEVQLLRVSSQLLGKMGYDVLTAPGGRQALEVVQKHKDEISLVILDLTMPDMSGAATFEKLREMAPSLKVLLASGFSAEGQASELLARGCNGFIQKPFDVPTLAETVRSLM